jgi:hypothetical protein
VGRGVRQEGLRALGVRVVPTTSRRQTSLLSYGLTPRDCASTTGRRSISTLRGRAPQGRRVLVQFGQERISIDERRWLARRTTRIRVRDWSEGPSKILNPGRPEEIPAHGTPGYQASTLRGTRCHCLYLIRYERDLRSGARCIAARRHDRECGIVPFIGRRGPQAAVQGVAEMDLWS